MPPPDAAGPQAAARAARPKLPRNGGAKPKASAAAIPLEIKLLPSQARGQDTYEVILATAGEMLCDIGFEQLSTNKVCERAGLTPPALYRYFPNKYALLKALADRIMRAQDEAVFAWLARGPLIGATVQETQAKAVAIQTEMIEIVRRAPGGVAVLRAIRAVPLLQKLRFASRDAVAAHVADAMRETFAPADWPRLDLGARMMVELLYAASEMVLEEPDRDAEAITREACLAFTLYFASFQTDARA